MLFSKHCFISLPLLFLFVALVIFILAPFHSVNGLGMPQEKMQCCQPAMSCCAAPMQCMQSCGGCGRRKRREAVQPQIKGREMPCPQTEWQPLMENAIVPLDDIESVNSIQKALMRRFPDNKFLVMCTMATHETKRTDGKQMLPNEVHLSSSGHGYCNVISERIWCQAAAIVA